MSTYVTYVVDAIALPIAVVLRQGRRSYHTCGNFKKKFICEKIFYRFATLILHIHMLICANFVHDYTLFDMDV